MVNFIESLRMLALKMALQISSDSVYEDSFALLTGWSINYLLGFWMRDLDCYVTTRIEFWHLQKKNLIDCYGRDKKIKYFIQVNQLESVLDKLRELDWTTNIK